MNEKKPVNVILQVVFAIIPISDVIACHKIQKLRVGLLLYWAGGAVVQIVQFFVFFGEGYYIAFWEFEARLPESVVLFTILFLILKAIVMKKWSQQWNKQYDLEIKN